MERMNSLKTTNHPNTNMRGLVGRIKKLRRTRVREVVKERLREFKEFRKKKNKEWFSELCFCILTANSRAKTAISVQKELTASGFYKYCLKDIRKAIKNNKHRFYNKKAEYIVKARKHIHIKEKIVKLVREKEVQEAREWLVKNIKGIGYKEASHFLRNTGHFEIAILDRHILNVMYENKVIREIPSTLSKKKYVELEKNFLQLASKLGMSPAELDLYMWYIKTGEVLK